MGLGLIAQAYNMYLITVSESHTDALFDDYPAKVLWAMVASWTRCERVRGVDRSAEAEEVLTWLADI